MNGQQTLILILFLLAIVMLFYPHWQRALRIKRWRHSLALDKHAANYQRLFAGMNGFALSRTARLEHDAIEYTYGEIEFVSFIALLSLTKPDNNTVFYDLGSGVGKAVFACAMVFDVHKACGVEIFHLLHNCAIKQQQYLQRFPDYLESSKAIHFINNDLLYVDLGDATLVFINATAFFGDTWVAINNYLLQVKPGTTIITTSKKLSSHAFLIKKTTTVQMSWGTVKAYIQTRL